jgi:hypothetical protein
MDVGLFRDQNEKRNDRVTVCQARALFWVGQPEADAHGRDQWVKPLTAIASRLFRELTKGGSISAVVPSWPSTRAQSPEFAPVQPRKTRKHTEWGRNRSSIFCSFLFRVIPCFSVVNYASQGATLVRLALSGLRPFV